MPPRAIDGWPDHWYNHDGFIPCPARGCTKVFNSGNIRWRGHHWDDQEPLSNTCYDHGILLAINRQIDCVYCDYHSERGLKDLLAHEMCHHGSSNMSTIEGYLRLMRRGLDTNEARLCEEQAFRRLLHNIWESPYRNRLLYRAYPRLLPHEARIWRHLGLVLSFPNLRAKRPLATVILAQDFLTHLRPTPDDQSPWPATYHELRMRYAEGSV